MALDFPANPTNGQTFGTYIYDSSIPGWRNVNSSEGIGLQFKSGLVPITPTSINVSSGSASVASDGTISLNSGDAIINGVFTSAYRNYKIMFTANGFSGNGNWGAIFAVRFAAGGVANGSSNYTHSTWYTQSGVNGNLNGTGTGTSWMWLGYAKDAVFEVFQPAVANTGAELAFTGNYNHTYMLAQGGYNANAVFDGIQFANNVYNATVRIYGYN